MTKSIGYITPKHIFF